MSSRLLLIVVIAHLLTIVPVVKAQSSTAQCLSKFDWMNNSRNQNPCLVAAYVQGACSGGEFTIGPLAPNTHYTGPTVAQANPCQCSTVAYSLVSACGICQNSIILSWSSWAKNCTHVYVAKYPESVPSGTAIPNWAFLNVTTSDAFNATVAKASGDTPESTASSAIPTGSISSWALLADTYPFYVYGGSSNKGAIAGGVIGSLVGLALVVGAVVYIRRRRRAETTPPLAYDSHGQDPPSEAPLDSSLPMQQFSEPPHGQTPYNGSNQYVGNHPHPLYNPDDPKTWPKNTRVGKPTVHRTTSGPRQLPHSASQPGQYTGAPEL